MIIVVNDSTLLQAAQAALVLVVDDNAYVEDSSVPTLRIQAPVSVGDLPDLPDLPAVPVTAHDRASGAWRAGRAAVPYTLARRGAGPRTLYAGPPAWSARSARGHV